MERPSVAARTVIEIGVENRDADGNLLIRTAALEQIPVENAFNPVQARTRRSERNRAKNGLGPDGFRMGASTHAIQCETPIYGSGIANRPPQWMQILRGCGFKELRLASIAQADAPAATAEGTAADTNAGDVDTGLAPGDYSYGYTRLYQVDGTTPAATLALGAFESKMAKVADKLTITGAGNCGEVSSLPAAGIKFLYRTKLGNDASTDPAEYQYVDMVADGATTFRDAIQDRNLRQRAPLSRTAPATPTAADQDAVAGALATTTTYHYKLTVLYDADGHPATTENAAVYESAPSADFSATTDNTNDAISVGTADSLPQAGVKRLYRADAGTTTNYRLVQTIPHGEDGPVIDGLAEGSRGAPLIASADHAIYVPVSEYEDFDALTFQDYLDSRNYPTKSARGGVEINGSVNENVIAVFNIEGVYTKSVKQANPEDQFSDPGDPPVWCDADLVLAPEGGVERTPIAVSFGFTIPRTPGARRSANAPCANKGVLEYQINQRVDPRLTLQIEVPNEIGEIADTDWVDDAVVGKYFGFRFHVGNDPRAQIVVTNDAPWGTRRYLAQLAEDVTFDTDQETSNRMFGLNFQLTERTGVANVGWKILHGIE